MDREDESFLKYDGYLTEREARWQEIMTVLPIEQVHIFNIFCRNYSVRRDELIDLLKKLATTRQALGALHDAIFVQLAQHEKLSPGESHGVYSLYAAFLNGNELNALIDFLREHSYV